MAINHIGRAHFWVLGSFHTFAIQPIHIKRWHVFPVCLCRYDYGNLTQSCGGGGLNRAACLWRDCDPTSIWPNDQKYAANLREIPSSYALHSGMQQSTQAVVTSCKMTRGLIWMSGDVWSGDHICLSLIYFCCSRRRHIWPMSRLNVWFVAAHLCCYDEQKPNQTEKLKVVQTRAWFGSE